MQEPRSEDRGSERARPSRRFHAAMTVGEALDTHPRARWVVTSYQLGGGGQCAVSDEESLAAVAEPYGITLERLLADLNAL